MAHRFSCTTVLQLVDSWLVKLCRYEDRQGLKGDEQSWMLDAAANYALACQLELASFKAHVGVYMGRHPSWIDLAQLEPGIAAVLRGACEALDKAAASARASGG